MQIKSKYVKPKLLNVNYLRLNEAVAACQMVIAYYQLWNNRGNVGYSTWEALQAAIQADIQGGDPNAGIWCKAWRVTGISPNSGQEVSFLFEDWDEDDEPYEGDYLSNADLHNGNLQLQEGYGTDGKEFIPLQLVEGTGNIQHS